MCRFLVYLGPPRTLETLVLSGDRSLYCQSWAPRHQVRGTVNADGFGVGWYDRAVRPEPARYRRPVAIWTDRSFASMAGLVRTDALLAAVRDATEPLPVEESGTQPFVSGPWLFAHNGCVDDWRQGAAATLRRAVSDRRLTDVEGASDSELLFALALDHLDDGASAGEALTEVVRRVQAISGGRLNMALTDGTTTAAVRVGDSLWTCDDDVSTRVASEPVDDDPRWQEVGEGDMVERRRPS